MKNDVTEMFKRLKDICGKGKRNMNKLEEKYYELEKLITKKFWNDKRKKDWE